MDGETSGPTNPAERRRWNDARWTSVWPKRERFTDSVTDRLLEAATLAPGERVLDIGCGGGKTTIEANRRVGPAGSATGADLSNALVALARSRAGAPGGADVEFHVVDMQYDQVPGGPFDVALSQFGVMFFDEPVTAFTNIARHLRPGGRLVFACWREAERNPWVATTAVAGFLPPAPPPAPGKSPTGPFALADADRTEQILLDAGLTDIRRTAIDISTDVPEGAIVDDEQLAFLGVPAGEMDAAHAAIDEHMSQFRLGNGLDRFPLSLQIFEARRPR